MTPLLCFSLLFYLCVWVYRYEVDNDDDEVAHCRLKTKKKDEVKEKIRFQI